jgi:conjugal transfer pilus assembly protein TraW
MKFHVNSLIIILLWTVNCCLAQDLGTRGATYPIGPDARAQFKQTIEDKYSSNEIKRFWVNYAKKSVVDIKNPKPLQGITSEYTLRSQLFEIKYLVDHDYVDAHNRIIVRKGTLIEPLKISNLKYSLLFIDGRDQLQIDYALSLIKKTPLKIVLTAGSAYELRIKYQGLIWMGAKHVPFYFDQRKMIIDQLSKLYQINITTVPAMVSQSKNQLRVDWGFLN